MQNLLKLHAPVTDSKVTKNSDDETVIKISGYANTAAKDRSGDVIPQSTWAKEGCLDNYNKNPIVLAYHDHKRPIGKAISFTPDAMGLYIEAEIYEEADPVVFSLIKRGVLKTFSIGFILKDATYDPDTDTFYLTEVELLENSVVSVPDNQDSVFNVSKQLGENNELLNSIKSRSAKKPVDKPSRETKTMSNENDFNVSDLVNDAVSKALEAQTAAQAEAERKAAEAAKQKEDLTAAAAEAATSAVKDTVIKSVTTAAERLSADLAKKLEDENASLSEVIKEHKEEIDGLRDELMSVKNAGIFTGGQRDQTAQRGISNEQKDTAVLLAKCLSNKERGQIKVHETAYGQEILKAAGFQADDTTTPIPGVHTVNDIDWETEFSMRMWDDVRRRLVVEPNFMQIAMRTNHMRIPVNPEQGYASYVAIDNFKGSNSTPAASNGNRLTEKTLIAHKLAAKDYIGDEETEDTLLPIMGIIRDNLIRRMAKSSERSVLLGVGATAADPVKGLHQFATDDGNDGTAASNTISIGGGGKLTAQLLSDARRRLGVFGLDPREILYIVGDKGYYDLMDDTNFRTRDKVGESNATILQGEIGRVNGSPVIVSGELSITPAPGNPVALVANMRNFYLGQLRGLRVQTDVDIEEEKTIIVASRRWGTVAMEANGAASVDFAA